MRWYAALLLQAQQDEEAARKVADKYEEKMARSRQIAEQRKALTSQLQRVRLSIAEQERLFMVRMHFHIFCSLSMHNKSDVSEHVCLDCTWLRHTKGLLRGCACHIVSA